MAARSPRLLLPAGATLTGIAGGAALAFGALFASVPVAAAGVIAAVVAAWFFVSPNFAFMATVLVVPVERLGRFTPDSAMYTISLMRIVGTLALASFIVHALLKRWRIYVELPHIAYAAYMLLALTGLVHTTDALGTVRMTGAILGNLLFLFLVTNMVRDWPSARRAAALWLAASLLVCIYTVVAWHFGEGVAGADVGETSTRFSTVLEDTSEYEALDTVARATGPTSHAAVYGINLVMTIPFLFYFMRETRSRWGRIAILSALALVLYNVLLANTRAAILLSALVILLCGVRGLYRVTLGGVVAAAIAILAVMPFVPDAVYERVLDPANYSYERSGTLRIRLEYWQAGLRVAQDHWLSGVGVGNQNVIPRYLTSDGPVATTVHNDYLMTFMEVGLFGWLVFFGFVAIVTWAAFAAARHARARDGPSSRYRFLVACQITLVTVLIYGLQVDVFHFPLKGWWLIAGISWSLWRSVRDERPASVAPNVNAAEA